MAGKADDIYATVEYLKPEDVEFVREPDPMNAITCIIAFFEAPNGYVFELNESLSKDA